MLAEAVFAAALARELPEIALTLQDGRKMSLPECRGRPTAVQIWATWCGPCRAELRLLQQVHEEWRAGACVIAIAVDAQGWRTVMPLVRELGLSLPVAVATPSALRRFGLRTPVDPIPQLLFYDRRGRLAAWFREALPPEALRAAMARAAKE
jgi:thiol-disulfide isomerase/thioredoxin